MRRPATGRAWRRMRGGSWRSIRWFPRRTAQLARAAEHLGERDEALTAYRAVALLDDTDPAEVHYRSGQAAARRGQAARSPPRGPPVIGRSASVSRRASALARAGRTGSPGPGCCTPVELPREGRNPMTRRRRLLCSLCRCAGDRGRRVAGSAVSTRADGVRSCGAAGDDSRGSRGRAQLEGGRALQERCLYVCEN